MVMDPLITLKICKMFSSYIIYHNSSNYFDKTRTLMYNRPKKNGVSNMFNINRNVSQSAWLLNYSRLPCNRKSLKWFKVLNYYFPYNNLNPHHTLDQIFRITWSLSILTIGENQSTQVASKHWREAKPIFAHTNTNTHKLKYQKYFNVKGWWWKRTLLHKSISLSRNVLCEFNQLIN